MPEAMAERVQKIWGRVSVQAVVDGNAPWTQTRAQLSRY